MATLGARGISCKCVQDRQALVRESGWYNCIVYDEDDYGSLTRGLWPETGDPKHSDRLPMILSNDRIGFLRTDGDPKPQKPTSNAVDRPKSKSLAGAYYSEN